MEKIRLLSFLHCIKTIFTGSTYEKIEVSGNKPYECAIDDYTLVVKEGTTAAVTLKSLFE